MKVSITNINKTIADEEGNQYLLKDLMGGSGRLINVYRETMGWQWRIGNRLIRVTK